MIVPDASVIAKFLIDEPDRPRATLLLEHAIAHGVELVAPSLLLYELLSIGLRHGLSFATVHDVLDTFRGGGLRLIEPSMDELQLAERIATLPARPSLQDSIYHAIAIIRDGMFVTADLQHVRKTAAFGHIVALADWRPA